MPPTFYCIANFMVVSLTGIYYGDARISFDHSRSVSYCYVSLGSDGRPTNIMLGLYRYE
jgi:hypothetical protein